MLNCRTEEARETAGDEEEVENETKNYKWYIWRSVSCGSGIAGDGHIGAGGFRALRNGYNSVSGGPGVFYIDGGCRSHGASGSCGLQLQ